MKSIKYKTPSGKMLELYTLETVAAQLGVSRIRVHGLLKEGI